MGNNPPTVVSDAEATERPFAATGAHNRLIPLAAVAEGRIDPAEVSGFVSSASWMFENVMSIPRNTRSPLQSSTSRPIGVYLVSRAWWEWGRLTVVQ
ncbi:MAG: hypothetical protein BRD21_04310 [Halobacteriales archaeon SW_8_66_22]|nr:MAG: hypothetical protein BRD21_04310 [Halobacteriales archaeon SW_8_66_22]